MSTIREGERGDEREKEGDGERAGGDIARGVEWGWGDSSRRKDET